MTTTLVVNIVIAVALLLFLVWLGTRHFHKYGPWEDYEVSYERGGKSLRQIATCKDRQCQKKKSRTVIG